MATERTTDIVLRAQVDKALQPLDQVLQRVKQLTTVLDQQRDAASKGDTTLAEYSKALRDVENAAKDLLRARVALNTYEDKQATLATKQQAVATARQARDTFQATLPADPTKAQERQLGSLEKALQKAENQANTASRAFEKAAAEMERMQIAVDKLDETHAQITIFRDMASDALAAGNAVNDTLIATLKVARAEKEANAQRIEDREKLLRAIAKTNAGLREEAETAEAAAAKDLENKQRMLARVNAGLGDLGAKQQAADALEAAKLQETAEKKRNADAEAAQNKARTIAQANVGIARLEAQEREKALAVETTLQQAADRARADAAQAAENKARTLAQANVGFARLEAAEREKAIAAEQALQEAADKQRVADAQTAAKAEAAAEKERAGLVQAVRNAETMAMREDARAQAATEEALAKQRKKDADEFQATQARLREAVAAVWAEEAADAEKARQGVEAFAASAAAALGRVREAMGHAAAQAGAVGAPVTLPATPLAEQVRTALGTAPGAAAGGGTLGGLQSEIAAITAAINTGAGAAKNYSEELKRLDAVARETVRQSQIIDSFQKQKEAARAALTAFHDLAEEIKALEAEAAKATTPEDVAEVTSKINAARRRLGSVEDGTGLAAQARKEIEAFEQEAAAVNALGIATDRVTAAMRELTNVAVSTSAERQTIMDKERLGIEASADAIIANARRTAAAVQTTLTTPASATPTSVVAQVQAVGGAGRGTAAVDDVTAATDKLEASMSRGRLTAQTYNKTMDELFAVQRQIASDASLIDNFKATDAAFGKASMAFNNAEMELLRLNAAVKAGTADIRELQQAEAAFDRASADLEKQFKLHQAIDAQLKARKIDTANLTAETNKLVQASSRLATVQNTVQQSSGKIFGLSSYQFQNLQFQVNDVITQLSLGQGLMRTFEAQAGQIFQIFDLSTAAMGRMLAIGGPLVLVILAIGASLLRLKEGIDAQREFNHQLALSADGAEYSSKALVQIARDLERMGVAFSDAKEAVKTGVREGFNPDAIERFGKAAHDLADVTGGEFKDAFKQVSVIATGSLQDILKLNDQYGFLHEAEYQAIQDSFRLGDSIEGRKIAFQSLQNALGNATKEGIDPFRESMRDLTNAWHDFLDAIASTGLFNAIAATLRAMASAAKELAADMRYLRDSIWGGDVTQRVKVVDAQISVLNDRIARMVTLIESLRKQGTPESDPTLKLLTEQAVKLREELEAAKIAKYNLTLPVPVAPGSLGSPVPAGGPLPAQFANLPSPDTRVNRAVPPDIQAIIEGTSAITAVSKETLSALYRLEADRNPDGSFKTSAAGARGPLQVMPDTFNEIVKANQGVFDEIAKALGKAISIDIPDFNILAGALYFKKQAQTFGSPALGAAAYNMGPGGLQSVLAGTKPLPRETAQYVSNFTAAGQGGGIGSDFLKTGTNQAQISMDEILYQLRKEIINNPNSLLRGDERIASDNARVEQFAKDLREKLNTALAGRQPTPEITAALNEQIEKFRKQLEDQRLKEIQDANKVASDILKSAQDAVDKSNKTDPAAQRRVVDRAYDSQLEAIEIQIRQGATEIAKQSLEAARDALLKARDEAREKATIDADRAIVDTIVKARDETIKKIQDDFKTGAINVQEMFRRIAEATGVFGPKIKEAIEKSNADLRRQPQTPAIQEQIAKNAGVSPEADKAGLQQDQATEARRNELLTARNKLEATYQEEVTSGALTQSEANEKSITAYQNVRDQIIAINAELQKQIDLQLATGKISHETWEQMSADIQKTNADAQGLTKEQKKFQTEIENTVSGAALRGFEALADNIGKVIAGTEKWSDAVKNIGVAFGLMVADVLKGIAEIILKEELLALVKMGMKALTGGAGAATSVAGDIPWDLPAAHAGGIAGAFNMSRSGINPMVFLNAPRMHNGGLASDEVAAVLKSGEEVLPVNDPRHRYNQMGKSSEVTSMPNIRQVLVMDPAQTSAALAGSHGEKVIITHIKNNAGAIRGILNQR
jgi:hypothetical protein